MMKKTLGEWFLWFVAVLFSVAVFLCAGLVYADTGDVDKVFIGNNAADADAATYQFENIQLDDDTMPGDCT
jgi:hypothetical protein